ncbi:MAG TPA: enoyl-CoA hydratase/isomerase family protein [Pseudolabrys sp.]|nr:enoyl-CoA hydratase/isomerase family protein [Pseudolabrys sp.]
MSIDFSVDDGVATIVLNRPECLNALDPAHYAALSNAFVIVRDDPSVRAAILTGAGEKSFTTGADLKAPMPRLDHLNEMMLTQRNQLPNRGMEIWKPIVAAVNGYCLAGGMCLLMATDIRIATQNASFGLPEIKRGGVPGNGGTQRIMQQLPYPIAMQMLLLGTSIDADTALRWGLINEVVSQSALLPTARDYARRIAAGPPLAIQAAKELALRSRDLDLASGLRLEQAMQSLLNQTHDWKEGGAAFAEKRAPRFEGR